MQMDDGLDSTIDGWKEKVKRKGRWWIHNIDGEEERWKRATKKEEKLRSESGRSEFFLQEKDGTNDVRAIKRIRKRAKRTSSRDMGREYIGFRNEMESLIICQNPTVRHMFSELMYWFEDETAFYVAMKFYPEGSLNVHCKEPVYESDGITIMKQVFEGLRFLHGEGIIHADLRSENILVTEGSPSFRIKLCDFSDSARSDIQFATINRKRASKYLAPEVIEFITNKQPSMSQTDIFDSGILMFWLFTMRLPGRNTFDVASEFKSVIEGTGSVSMVAAIFLQDLVHKDPLRRPTASDALESRWISETTGWEKEEMKSAKDPTYTATNESTSSSLSRPITPAKKTHPRAPAVESCSDSEVVQVEPGWTRGESEGVDKLSQFASWQNDLSPSDSSLELQDRASSVPVDEAFEGPMSVDSMSLDQSQPQTSLDTSFGSTTSAALVDEDNKIQAESRMHTETSSEVKIQKLKAERIQWSRKHDKDFSDAESEYSSAPTPTTSDIDLPALLARSQATMPVIEPFGERFDETTDIGSVGHTTSGSRTPATPITEKLPHIPEQSQSPIESPGIPSQTDLGGLIITYISAGDIRNFRSILPMISKETLDSTLDGTGRSAFWLAASLNRLEMLRALWEEKNVKVETVDKFGQTALHGAVQKGSIEVIEYLATKMELSKNFWAQEDNNKETPLSLARRISDQNRRIISLILEQSGGLENQKSPNNEDQIRLSRALDDVISWEPSTDQPLPDHTEFEKLLCESEARISVDQIYKLVSADSEHRNGLVLAVHLRFFRGILKRLYSLTVGSIKEKFAELATTIYSLLRKAHRGPQMEMEFILEGCQTYQPSSGFYLALLPRLFSCASKNPNEGILFFLVRSKRHNGQVTSEVVGPHLLDLISEGNTVAVQIILRAKPDLANFQKPGQDTALIYALSSSPINPEVIRCLVGYRADIAIHRRIDLEGYDYLQRTPLHFAVLMNSVPLLRILLKAEIHMVQKAVKATDSSGFTPLLLAAYRKETNPEIIELLIQAKSDLNAQDHVDERTPLAWAFCKGATSTVQVLLSRANADEIYVNARDVHSHTILFYASTSKRPKIEHVKHLLDLLQVLCADRNSLEKIEEAAKQKLLAYAVCQSQIWHDLSTHKTARPDLSVEERKHLEDWTRFLDGIVSRGPYYYLEDGVRMRVIKNSQGFYRLETTGPKKVARPDDRYHFRKTKWSDSVMEILD